MAGLLLHVARPLLNLRAGEALFHLIPERHPLLAPVAFAIAYFLETIAISMAIIAS